jgi:CheY-like chemotaxis protein
MIWALVGGEEEQKFLEQAARNVRIEIRMTPDAGLLMASLAERLPEMVLLDVTTFGIDGVETLAKIKSNRTSADIQVVAFGDSLRADLLQDASESGADLVLSRSAFHKQLRGILRRFGNNSRS